MVDTRRSSGQLREHLAPPSRHQAKVDAVGAVAVAPLWVLLVSAIPKAPNSTQRRRQRTNQQRAVARINTGHHTLGPETDGGSQRRAMEPYEYGDNVVLYPLSGRQHGPFWSALPSGSHSPNAAAPGAGNEGPHRPEKPVRAVVRRARRAGQVQKCIRGKKTHTMPGIRISGNCQNGAAQHGGYWGGQYSTATSPKMKNASRQP